MSNLLAHNAGWVVSIVKVGYMVRGHLKMKTFTPLLLLPEEEEIVVSISRRFNVYSASTVYYLHEFNSVSK